MAGPDIWHATLQLVSQSTDYLSREFRGGIFPVDLSHTAIGVGGLFKQHRMVCFDGFSFRAWNFSAQLAHCPLPHVGRHLVRGALLYGASAHRAALRYCA